MEPTLLQTDVDPQVIADGVNLLWVLVVTFLIFFMHAGFAMLEAGQVRSKNVANQLTKNLLTWSVGVAVFFLIGAAISGVVGGDGFSLTLAAENPNAWVDWLFGAVFAMTAATIVSGAVAGRAKLRAYVATPSCWPRSSTRSSPGWGGARQGRSLQMARSVTSSEPGSTTSPAG